MTADRRQYPPCPDLQTCAAPSATLAVVGGTRVSTGTAIACCFRIFATASSISSTSFRRTTSSRCPGNPEHTTIGYALQDGKTDADHAAFRSRARNCCVMANTITYEEVPALKERLYSLMSLATGAIAHARLPGNCSAADRESTRGSVMTTRSVIGASNSDRFNLSTAQVKRSHPLRHTGRASYRRHHTTILHGSGRRDDPVQR